MKNSGVEAGNLNSDEGVARGMRELCSFAKETRDETNVLRGFTTDAIDSICGGIPEGQVAGEGKGEDVSTNGYMDEIRLCLTHINNNTGRIKKQIERL